MALCRERISARTADRLAQAGLQFHAITIDGRRSAFTVLRKHYPGVAVQLCQFHFMQNLRRILGVKPATGLGVELLALINRTHRIRHEAFAEQFLYLTERKYAGFTGARGERKANQAVRAIRQALPYLFTCQKYPDQHIPNTTNSCEGAFGQWKLKIKLHRGTTIPRQQKNDLRYPQLN